MARSGQCNLPLDSQRTTWVLWRGRKRKIGRGILTTCTALEKQMPQPAKAYYSEQRGARKDFYESWHSRNLTTQNQAKLTVVFMPTIRRGWWERKKEMSSGSETHNKKKQFLALLSALREKGDLISVADSPAGLMELCTHPTPPVMSLTNCLQNLPRLLSKPVLKHSLITPY